MQSIGLHPDANIFNSLLDVLWQSGIALAQARALQLWSVANRSGLFRIYSSNPDSSQLRYSALAMSGGAMSVTVLRWVGEMKSRLAREGPSFLRNQVTLLLYRSKSGSGSYSRSVSNVQESSEAEAVNGEGRVTPAIEPFSASIQDSISAMMSGASAPFTVTLPSSQPNDLEPHNMTSLGSLILKIEAQSAQLTPWLSSNECSSLLLLKAQGGSIQLRKSHESALNDDMALAMRSREACETAMRVELSQALNLSEYNTQVLNQRIQVVGTAIKICGALRFMQDAVYDSLLRFDRCISALGPSFDPNSWLLLLCACILHSGQQADNLTRMILAITGGREGQVRMNLTPQSHELASTIIQQPIEAIVAMERSVAEVLGMDRLGNYSPLKFVELFLQRLGPDVINGGEGSTVARMNSDIHVILTKAACCSASIRFRPSLVASAALLLARKKHGAVPFWPGALQIMTGYSLSDLKSNHPGESELSACAACLSALDE